MCLSWMLNDLLRVETNQVYNTHRLSTVSKLLFICLFFLIHLISLYHDEILKSICIIFFQCFTMELIEQQQKSKG